MSLPSERSNAIRSVREFLRALLDPKKTPRVPRHIRLEAYYRLKHYPSDLDIRRAKTRYNDVFEPLEEEQNEN